MTDLRARKRVFMAYLHSKLIFGQEDYHDNAIQLPALGYVVRGEKLRLANRIVLTSPGQRSY
jgi:hypothetical protein